MDQAVCERVTELAWAPQPGPQHALVHCPVPEILFGGARGGGKTDGVIGKWAIKASRYAEMNAIFFRKEMPQTDDLIQRARQVYEAIGAQWTEHKKLFEFPNGARIRFRPLENVADAEKYQGQNLSDVAVEEAGNYATSAPIDMLFGALRSKGGVPIQMILTANPGGAGQQWIKSRFIDPNPQGMKPITVTLPNGRHHRRVYIPSRVQDNRVLLSRDPDYVSRLYLVGSEALVQAWLAGDWSAVEGAYFDSWSTSRHVVRPFAIPAHWMRFRSFDWGSAHPFSVGWWAVASEVTQAGSVTLPVGCMVRYREWYGCQAGKPNTGLKMSADAVARGILERETPNENVLFGVADPAIFAENGGPSIADTMRLAGVAWRPADNARVAHLGALGGWDQLRQRLTGDGDGNPMIATFATCADSIRTIPVLQHDKRRAEDLDTSMEDHAADEWRYACMARPWVAPLPSTGAQKSDYGFGRRSREADTWKTV